MKEYGPSASPCLPSTVIKPKCLLHALSRPISGKSSFNSRLVSQLLACRLPAPAARPSASPAGPLLWSSIQRCKSSSYTHRACRKACKGHQPSCSISIKPEPLAPLQGSSLRLRCMPLDRRWHSQSACQCLSDAVGPLAGGSEAACSARDAKGHGAKHAKTHQVRLCPQMHMLSWNWRSLLYGKDEQGHLTALCCCTALTGGAMDSWEDCLGTALPPLCQLSFVMLRYCCPGKHHVSPSRWAECS